MYRNPCLFWHSFLHYISWEGIHASSQKFPQRSLHPCVQHVQRSESSPDPLFPERTVCLTSYTAFTTFAAKRCNTDHLCSSHTIRFCDWIDFFFSLGLTYRSIILTYPSVCLLYVMLGLFLKSIFYDMHFSQTYKRAVSKTKSATPSSFSYEFPITWYWLNVRLIKTKPCKQNVHSTNLYCDHTQQTRWIYCLAFKWQNLMFGHVCSLLMRRGGKLLRKQGEMLLIGFQWDLMRLTRRTV